MMSTFFHRLGNLIQGKLYQLNPYNISALIFSLISYNLLLNFARFPSFLSKKVKHIIGWGLKLILFVHTKCSTEVHTQLLIVKADYFVVMIQHTAVWLNATRSCSKYFDKFQTIEILYKEYSTHKDKIYFRI